MQGQQPPQAQEPASQTAPSKKLEPSPKQAQESTRELAAAKKLVRVVQVSQETVEAAAEAMEEAAAAPPRKLAAAAAASLRALQALKLLQPLPMPQRQTQATIQCRHCLID